MDGATSHITAYLRKSTSSSKTVSKLHEWMDSFQVNPKANGSDIAFHHPHDMQAFNRMHDVKSLPTGPHTLWPNRVDMSVRLQIFSGQDYSVTDHTCTVDAQGSEGEKHTGNSEWQYAYGNSHRKETSRSPGPSVHESRAADIHANQARPPQSLGYLAFYSLPWGLYSALYL